jgi:uncharacterized protein YndB with AHSA1/START domain
MMENAVFVTRSVAVRPEKAWDAIAAVGGLDRWFPVIADCAVEGSGVGAVRTMHSVDGGRIIDHIIEVDPAARRLRYDRVEIAMPVSRYIGAVTVELSGTDACRITWTVDLETPTEVFDDVRAGLQQAISDGVDGLAAELSHP